MHKNETCIKIVPISKYLDAQRVSNFCLIGVEAQFHRNVTAIIRNNISYLDAFLLTESERTQIHEKHTQFNSVSRLYVNVKIIARTTQEKLCHRIR